MTYLSRLMLCSCIVFLMAGCMATAPTADGRDTKPLEVYELYMTDAEQKLKAGQRESAVSALSDAAKVAPTRKEPWLRMAQIHFDSNNHGQAITAAQEVLSRDSADKSARSIMAVTGLRVSVKALSELRTDNALSADARSEAESLARTLRETLGATVLVPAPASATPPARTSVGNEQRPSSGAVVPASPAPAVPGTRPRRVTNPSPSSPSGANSPFGSLK